MLAVTAGGLATAGEAAAVDAPSAAADATSVAAVSTRQKVLWLFGNTMSTFQKYRNAKTWGNVLDYSSDGCSWAPNKPSGFNFLPACQRHDFGYRNFKKQHMFNKRNKKIIDNKLAHDMYSVCNKYGAAKRNTCKSIAGQYYVAVRGAGS
ncbi:phospholipase [Streptomyces lydicamycinicus]|uniref:phospholipase n=1 Tax=Streptomyces lydicamycinicus TaxID=1546107 RepID=UPI003C2C243B